MMKLALLVVVAATLVVMCSAHNHRRTSSNETVVEDHGLNAEEREALFDRVRKELEARNYSHPLASYYGVDLSSGCATSTWKCLKGAGKSFGIVRQYEAACRVDGNGRASVANAWAAGIAHVDIYLFPAFGCGYSAASQVDQAIDGMSSTPFGTLWFDVEASGSGWSGDKSRNNAWLAAGTARAVERLGHNRVGIYSSAYGWSVAMGSYAGASSFPIWYAHYDNSPSFGDFKSFGGWSHPAMKQYAGTSTSCGEGIDSNYYP